MLILFDTNEKDTVFWDRRVMWFGTYIPMFCEKLIIIFTIVKTSNLTSLLRY